MLIIISSWLQKAFKVLCSSQHQNTEIRKEISALTKRPVDGNGVFIWSRCRNRSPYSTNWITWFVFSFLIHDILLSDIFSKGFHTRVVAIFANLLNSNGFFCYLSFIYTDFNLTLLTENSHKTHSIFSNNIFPGRYSKRLYLFIQFPAGNLIHYCRVCIKSINSTNDISVYNALSCKNVLEELAFEWNMMTATNSDLRKFLGALQEHEQESRVNSNRVQCLVAVGAERHRHREWFRPILF